MFIPSSGHTLFSFALRNVSLSGKCKYIYICECLNTFVHKVGSAVEHPFRVEELVEWFKALNMYVYMYVYEVCIYFKLKVLIYIWFDSRETQVCDV